MIELGNYKLKNYEVNMFYPIHFRFFGVLFSCSRFISTPFLKLYSPIYFAITHVTVFVCLFRNNSFTNSRCQLSFGRIFALWQVCIIFRFFIKWYHQDSISWTRQKVNTMFYQSKLTL